MYKRDITTSHRANLSDVFLDELGTNDTNEAGVCAIGHCSSTQSLASAWWTKHQYALRWINAEVHKSLWLKVTIMPQTSHKLQIQKPTINN